MDRNTQYSRSLIPLQPFTGVSTEWPTSEPSHQYHVSGDSANKIHEPLDFLSDAANEAIAIVDGSRSGRLTPLLDDLLGPRRSPTPEDQTRNKKRKLNDKRVDIPGYSCFQPNREPLDPPPGKGRKGPLDKAVRRKVAQVRAASACYRCRWQKKPCSSGRPCVRCLQAVQSKKQAGYLRWMDCFVLSLVEIGISSAHFALVPAYRPYAPYFAYFHWGRLELFPENIRMALDFLNDNERRSFEIYQRLSSHPHSSTYADDHPFPLCHYPQPFLLLSLIRKFVKARCLFGSYDTPWQAAKSAPNPRQGIRFLAEYPALSFVEYPALPSARTQVLQGLQEMLQPSYLRECSIESGECLLWILLYLVLSLRSFSGLPNSSKLSRDHQHFIRVLSHFAVLLGTRLGELITADIFDSNKWLDLFFTTGLESQWMIDTRNEILERNFSRLDVEDPAGNATGLVPC